MNVFTSRRNHFKQNHGCLKFLTLTWYSIIYLFYSSTYVCRWLTIVFDKLSTIRPIISFTYSYFLYDSTTYFIMYHHQLWSTQECKFRKNVVDLLKHRISGKSNFHKCFFWPHWDIILKQWLSILWSNSCPVSIKIKTWCM